MRNRSARLWVVGLAVGTLAVAGVTNAGPHGRHGNMRGNALAAVIEANAVRLQLDDATQARIREIAESARAERESFRESMRGERKVLHELLKVDSPDEAAVLAQADVIGALDTEMRKASLRTRLALRALLTPEQRAELAAIRAERRDARREKRQDGRHRRGL